MITSPSPDNNTAIGREALFSNTTGIENTASGVGALRNNTDGNSNTASGKNALGNNTTGFENTASGANTLVKNTTGHSNTAIGTWAGSAVTAGEHNIYVNNPGVEGDLKTIRIGESNLTHAFIAGIRDVTTEVADATAVYIDSAGQLGTISSSRRVKDEIREMSEASNGLLQLRPVTIRYKQAYADGARPVQYGLIAEEVATVYPNLVTHSADGQIQSVQYHTLVPMLLNELQKQHRLIQDLTARLARLEAVSQRESGLVTAQRK